MQCWDASFVWRIHVALCLLALSFSEALYLLELLQIFVPDRDARISDALEKLAGGFVGIVLANAIQTFSGFRGRKI